MSWELPVLSGLGGALVTAISYTIAFSGRLTKNAEGQAKMGENQKSMASDIGEIKERLKAWPIICPHHADTLRRLETCENKVMDGLEKRVRQLETKIGEVEDG